MRAKVRLSSITDYGSRKDLEFSAVTGGGPENQAFWKATPNGTIKLSVDNLPAVEEMKVGQFFYVDFTPAPS